MIVVDTNIIAYLYLESERSPQVEQLFRWLSIPIETGANVSGD